MFETKLASNVSEIKKIIN